MGASEARNGRGSPGDQTLQKVRAVEVVHVDRFLDLDLVLGAVKMGPVTWQQAGLRQNENFLDSNAQHWQWLVGGEWAAHLCSQL